MSGSMYKGLIYLSLIPGSCGLAQAAPPVLRHVSNPVTLSKRIEPVDQDSAETERIAKAERAAPQVSAPKKFMGIFLKPRADAASVAGDTSAQDEPAESRRKIHRVSFPELFPTPAERPGNQKSSPVPPPPNLDVGDNQLPLPAPGSAPPPSLFVEQLPSDYQEYPGYVVDPNCIDSQSETPVETVTPQTCRKWRLIRCPTFRALWDKCI